MNGVNLRDLIKDAKCSYPYSGNNAIPGAKKTGCCPVCGASSFVYRYPPNTRFKHCYKCGYDREEQRVFEYARHQLRYPERHNHEPDDVIIMRVWLYYDAVFNKSPGHHSAPGLSRC